MRFRLAIGTSRALRSPGSLRSLPGRLIDLVHWFAAVHDLLECRVEPGKQGGKGFVGIAHQSDEHLIVVRATAAHETGPARPIVIVPLPSIRNSIFSSFIAASSHVVRLALA